MFTWINNNSTNLEKRIRFPISLSAYLKSCVAPIFAADRVQILPTCVINDVDGGRATESKLDSGWIKFFRQLTRFVTFYFIGCVMNMECFWTRHLLAFYGYKTFFPEQYKEIAFFTIIVSNKFYRSQIGNFSRTFNR